MRVATAGAVSPRAPFPRRHIGGRFDQLNRPGGAGATRRDWFLTDLAGKGAK